MVSIFQIEGSFIQGIGFFIYEEYITNNDGFMISNSTWDYKIPSVDIIPKQFNAEVLNTGYHKNRVLSSKGRHFSGFLGAIRFLFRSK
jgi:abscisic-aldehyde oxidase